MTRTKTNTSLAACVFALAIFASAAGAQESVAKAAKEVNQKMVKLFGIGGFKGLPSYGTGILVSAEGHILTVNNHILINPGILVHLYDGRQYQAKVLFREPAMDVALLKIDEKVDFLPHYKFELEAVRPMAENGDWTLAFSNQFKIAMRDEPMSVQRGGIAAVADMRGRRGVFDAPYGGDVYYLDGVACNPGAAGGALTDRKGHLLGILGRELKDNRIDTWINYAVPIQAAVDLQREDKKSGKTSIVKVSMAMFVDEAMKGDYKQSTTVVRVDKGGYHGIILVHNAVSSTPPYIEEVVADSPAAKANLQPDDLILYVEGFSVPTIKVFRETMKQYAPGDDVSVQVQRGNRLESVKLKLANQPKVPTSN
jgi:serine protease Do